MSPEINGLKEEERKTRGGIMIDGADRNSLCDMAKSWPKTVKEERKGGPSGVTENGTWKHRPALSSIYESEVEGGRMLRIVDRK